MFVSQQSLYTRSSKVYYCLLFVVVIIGVISMVKLGSIKSGLRNIVLGATLSLMPISLIAQDDLYYMPSRDNSKTKTEYVASKDDSNTAETVVNESKSFIGRPVSISAGSDNLEFVLESYDSDANKKYSITVSEEFDQSNKSNLAMVKSWTDAALKDSSTEFRVEGFYTKNFIKDNVEYGKLDPFAIVRVENTIKNDGIQKSEEVVFTDKKDSPIYSEKNSTIIINNVYRPGHFVHHVHYPLYVSPYWDSDGDGIPNAWDPMPFTFGPWVDVNTNGVWDWYDPCLEPSYWGYWDGYYGHNSGISLLWGNYYGSHHHDRDHGFYDRYREHHRDANHRLTPKDHDRRITPNHNNNNRRKDYVAPERRTPSTQPQKETPRRRYVPSRNEYQKPIRADNTPTYSVPDRRTSSNNTNYRSGQNYSNSDYSRRNSNQNNNYNSNSRRSNSGSNYVPSRSSSSSSPSYTPSTQRRSSDQYNSGSNNRSSGSGNSSSGSHNGGGRRR
jgi:hypothetical protein